ncbi:uncharacterized protein LOC128787779 isoform X2 [Vidua chalybeata]|uniref:uncharacterized protein LOC128787779 isoform X2 n=1 Tax=Vidua chalybeata TaxID=81927 RepID=UPI0023A8604D|nr:uncharacterized protein LOC128787779 isoform X2 [Vidua chalybeata]
MSSHALQKRVGWLFSSRRQQWPSSIPCGQPCAAATGASELSDKVQGRLHRAAARHDLAWLRRWRWYFKRVGMDPRDQRRRCFRTALAITTSHEADVEEDNLCLQEELERVEVEGRGAVVSTRIPLQWPGRATRRWQKALPLGSPKGLQGVPPEERRDGETTKERG